MESKSAIPNTMYAPEITDSYTAMQLLCMELSKAIDIVQANGVPSEWTYLDALVSVHSVASNLIKEEKQQLMAAYEVGNISMMTPEQYYDEIFNRK